MPLKSTPIFATIAVAVALTGCTGDYPDADAEPNRDEGPTATAPAALTVGGPLRLYPGAMFLGAGTAYGGDYAEVEPTAVSLKNEGYDFFTVYAEAGYLGRCQNVPPGASYSNLFAQPIGANAIKFVRRGAYCTPRWFVFAVNNYSGMLLRARVRLPRGTTEWTSTIALEQEREVRFDGNTWTARFEIEYQTSVGWELLCSKDVTTPNGVVGTEIASVTGTLFNPRCEF